MAIRKFGKLLYDEQLDSFIIAECEPHISMRLKNVFQKIDKSSSKQFKFKNTPVNCTDLIWFMDRYPLEYSADVNERLQSGMHNFKQLTSTLEQIHFPGYIATKPQLKDGKEARNYQITAKDTVLINKRLLLGDDLGLGKTLSAILLFLHNETLPGLVVVQTHLPTQWRVEGIEKFTNLKVHVVNGTKPYNLPPADVYIMKYSCLIGWVDILATGFFKSVVFDEAQELRRYGSGKYLAAQAASKAAEWVVGLTATPIYNYGDEMFNVLDLINPGCLGTEIEFLREWAIPHGNHYKIRDPQALGTYLREQFLFLRRTRAEVGRELPPVNKIIHTVGYDEVTVKKSEDLARSLAMRVMEGSFTERGEAARELDLLARYITGVSKAKEVAEYVRILLDNDQPVVLAGWHRDVYRVWLEELKDYNPVMYTGTESITKKESAKKDFMAGKTKLFIISLRSGAGLDGLQQVCQDMVFGELDWSPKVHDQLIGRLHRDRQDDEDPWNITAHYLVSDSGSDPVMINLLGLKSSQAQGIVDPLKDVESQYSDESRMKALARKYLEKKDSGKLELF